MILNIDTTKIKVSAETIEKLADDYNQVIENVFAELINLETSGAWAGENYNSSIYRYLATVKKDKKDYNDLAFDIKKLGVVLKEYTANLEKTTNEKI